VFTTLDRGTETIRCVEDLVGKTLGHRLLAARFRVRGEPAEGEAVGAVGLDLDGHLVGGPPDAAALDLNGGAHVVERLLECRDGILTVLRGNADGGVVHDSRGETLLAVGEDLVDELAGDRRPVDGVGDDRALRSWSLARHYFFAFLAP